MTSGWDGHYCEENFLEVVFEIAIIIAISSIGRKKFEICVGFEVCVLQRNWPQPAAEGNYPILIVKASFDPGGCPILASKLTLSLLHHGQWIIPLRIMESE